MARLESFFKDQHNGDTQCIHKGAEDHIHPSGLGPHPCTKRNVLKHQNHFGENQCPHHHHGPPGKSDPVLGEDQGLEQQQRTDPGTEINRGDRHGLDFMLQSFLNRHCQVFPVLAVAAGRQAGFTVYPPRGQSSR